MVGGWEIQVGVTIKRGGESKKNFKEGISVSGVTARFSLSF